MSFQFIEIRALRDCYQKKMLSCQFHKDWLWEICNFFSEVRSWLSMTEKCQKMKVLKCFLKFGTCRYSWCFPNWKVKEVIWNPPPPPLQVQLRQPNARTHFGIYPTRPTPTCNKNASFNMAIWQFEFPFIMT